MSSTPRVSILLPARDSAATIGDALTSCLDQTFKDFEILAVDDSSEDETGRIIEQFAAKDGRVRHVATDPPGGLVGALNLAAAEARGEFLARMDADDFAYPERLAKQVALLDARPQVAVASCLIRILGSVDSREGHPAAGFRRYEEWLNSVVEPDQIARERFVESPIAHPTVMMRREAFESVGGYRDPSWAEDYDLCLRFLDAGMQIAKVPEVLLDWFDGPSRLTRTAPRYSEEAFLHAKAHYLSRLPAIRERGAAISGAGPTGKAIARLLVSREIAVHAFYDVHPRRSGSRIAGIPVHSAEDLPPAGPDQPIHLAAVGQPNRRPAIRELLNGLGLVEGVDWFAVA
ncbi:glycosyltransferase [bacterium]|nr:glycosyltransferase [bacterium]